MGPVNDIDERLVALEHDMVEIKARMGTVQLSAPTLALLWAVMLAAITCVMFVVRLDSKVEQYAKTSQEAHDRIYEHAQLDGHALSNERIEALTRRLDAFQPPRRSTSQEDQP